MGFPVVFALITTYVIFIYYCDIHEMYYISVFFCLQDFV